MDNMLKFSLTQGWEKSIILEKQKGPSNIKGVKSNEENNQSRARAYSTITK
jgi:hypothetical protein